MDRDPTLLMKIFEHAQRQGVGLNVKVKSLIRRKLDLVNDKFRRNREVSASFLNILRSDKGVAETLRLMHHLEFLMHYIPEFERIYCKVQHDLYHIYTVDVHSLFSVEEIIRLQQGEHRESLPLLTSTKTLHVQKEPTGSAFPAGSGSAGRIRSGWNSWCGPTS